MFITYHFIEYNNIKIKYFKHGNVIIVIIDIDKIYLMFLRLPTALPALAEFKFQISQIHSTLFYLIYYVRVVHNNITLFQESKYMCLNVIFFIFFYYNIIFFNIKLPN